MAQTITTEEAAKRIQERQRLKAQRHADDIKWLLGDERGRRLYWKWLSDSHIFRTSFTGNSETFFKEGERNRGLEMLADLNEHSPEAYLQMQQEAAFEDRQDREFKRQLEEAQEREKN